MKLLSLIQNEDIFQSPTFGPLTFSQVVERLSLFTEADLGLPVRVSKHRYRIIVGTDSAPRNGAHTEYISAIIAHRVGSGGIYFWQRTITPVAKTLRERIYQEA